MDDAIGLMHHDCSRWRHLAIGVQEAVSEDYCTVAEQPTRSLNHTCLYLSQLNAHSANLDLIVKPAKDLQLSTNQSPSIPTAVPAPAHAGQIDKLFRCELRSVVIAHAHLHPALNYLPFTSIRHQSHASSLKQANKVAWVRRSHQRRRIARSHVPYSLPDCALCCAVRVQQSDAHGPIVQQRLRAPLTTQAECGQCGQRQF
mmetsp:Transcript_115484/g.321737  ORF Transcript_115484/g.321737 Transcript_115484/m.321737 type:complete len:201 (-) Transcript_115484:144-746(-)